VNRLNLAQDEAYYPTLMIKDLNSLPAGILASFPCKLNTFRKRVREAVTSK
jgi:hypothetical protein